MALDVVHRTAVAVWLGGLMHLLAGALRGRGQGAPELAPLLRRFSGLALGAALILILSGVVLTVYYVNSVRSLVGTAYGVMVLSKVVLLGALLGLGALNFVAVRRMASGSAARIRWVVEAELGGRA
jgi:putative copper export protein